MDRKQVISDINTLVEFGNNPGLDRLVNRKNVELFAEYFGKLISSEQKNFSVHIGKILRDLSYDYQKQLYIFFGFGIEEGKLVLLNYSVGANDIIEATPGTTDINMNLINAFVTENPPDGYVPNRYNNFFEKTAGYYGNMQGNTFYNYYTDIPQNLGIVMPQIPNFVFKVDQDINPIEHDIENQPWLKCSVTSFWGIEIKKQVFVSIFLFTMLNKLENPGEPQTLYDEKGVGIIGQSETYEQLTGKFFVFYQNLVTEPWVFSAIDPTIEADLKDTRNELNAILQQEIVEPSMVEKKEEVIPELVEEKPPPVSKKEEKEDKPPPVLKKEEKKPPPPSEDNPLLDFIDPFELFNPKETDIPSPSPKPSFPSEETDVNRLKSEISKLKNENDKLKKSLDTGPEPKFDDERSKYTKDQYTVLMWKIWFGKQNYGDKKRQIVHLAQEMEKKGFVIDKYFQSFERPSLIYG